MPYRRPHRPQRSRVTAQQRWRPWGKMIASSTSGVVDVVTTATPSHIGDKRANCDISDWSIVSWQRVELQ